MYTEWMVDFPGFSAGIRSDDVVGRCLKIKENIGNDFKEHWTEEEEVDKENWQ